MASPSEQQLQEAVISLKQTNPSFGITKIHGLLLQAHPSWVVSEKRTRKALQSQGLVNVPSQSPPNQNNSNVFVYPSSKLIPNLELEKYTNKVEVRQFGKKKGKGLVAKEKIAEGETIWKEDPYVVAPEWEIYDLQKAGQACSFCTTPFSSATTTSLITSCAANTSLSTSAAFCPARFCNRLCRERSARTHPLLCPAQNPASVPLMAWVRETEWMALHALACTTSRVLIVSQTRDGVEEEWKIFSSFATMSMEDRAKYHFHNVEPDSQSWRKAFKLYVQAFTVPVSDRDKSTEPDVDPERKKILAEYKKKLTRIIKTPLKPEISQGLFQYDAFLRNLGKMNLNLEAHGGLYILHSHLNHCCEPNVSIRHLDQRTSLSRITAIARRPIEPNEELVITYVNPEWGVGKRRKELEAWGFGKCGCDRCRKEENEMPVDGSISGEALNMDDLERELKAGLGVM